jgi:hypothetical protein
LSAISIDTLFLRRPRLNYVSPPVCEALFSGTGSPIIILPEIGRLTGPTGLVLSGSGRIRLSWNNYPGALCYNVYSAVLTGTVFTDCTHAIGFAQSARYELIGECVSGNFFDLTQQGCFRISAITGEGETDLSDPACSQCYTPPCPFGSAWNPTTFRCEACDFSSGCPGGFTPDEVLCQCVPCGTQHCNEGFLIDTAHPCNCIPCGTQACPAGTYLSITHPCNCVTGRDGDGQGDVVEVCNQEQTAECVAPESGDPVTIPAGTFCKQVQNATVDSIAAAQAEVNEMALSEAESELNCCGPLPDWSQLSWGTATTQICNAGAASFTPSGSDNASFTAQSSTASALAGAATASNTGTLSNYIGPIANCNLHLVITGTAIGSPSGVTSSGTIVIRSNGFAVLSRTFESLGAGTHDLAFSFSAPQCAETPQTITVDVSVITGTFGGPLGCATSVNSSINVTGTLSVT